LAGRVARHDAAGRELVLVQLRRAERSGDRVPDADDALVVDGVDDEVDGLLRDVTDLVPGRLNVLDGRVEGALQAADDLLEAVEDRADALLPGPLPGGHDPVPGGLDGVLPQPLAPGADGLQPCDAEAEGE